MEARRRAAARETQSLGLDRRSREPPTLMLICIAQKLEPWSPTCPLSKLDSRYAIAVNNAASEREAEMEVMAQASSVWSLPGTRKSIHPRTVTNNASPSCTISPQYHEGG